MATTDPLTGATIQDMSDGATGGTQIGNVVKNLRSFLVTRFSTTGARDTAYTSFVSGGGVMADGMLTAVGSTLYRRISGSWRINRNRIIKRTISAYGAGGVIASGGAAETGVTAGYTALSSFTLYEASTVSVMAHFRVNPGVGGAGLRVKIDGTQVGFAAATRDDISGIVIGAVALTAGSHTISLRVDAVGASVTWSEGEVVIHEGTAE